jgi:hypothetical protein
VRSFASDEGINTFVRSLPQFRLQRHR